MIRRNKMMDENTNNNSKSFNDIESGFNRHSVSVENDYDKKTCAIFCIICVQIPFMICDLYFGSSNQPCLDMYFSEIRLNFRTWLIVSGFIHTFMVILWCMVLYKNVCMYFAQIFSKIAGIFLISWIITGSIVFWKYLEPNKLCDNELTNFILVRIITGLFATFSIFCNNKRE